MIAWLVNQIRMAMCAHKWTQLHVTETYQSEGGQRPLRRRLTQLCEKCGMITRTRV